MIAKRNLISAMALVFCGLARRRCRALYRGAVRLGRGEFRWRAARRHASRPQDGRQIPAKMIGRILAQSEAEALVKKISGK